MPFTTWTRISRAALAAAALAAATPALPCSVCGCGDPLLSASDPAATTGRMRVQLDVEYLRMDAANEEDPAVTDRLDQWSYRLNGVYRPTEDLALSVTVPLVTKTMSMRDAAGSMPTSDATGLGDVEVAVRWAPWRSVSLGTGRVQELALSAGTSTPTGANDVHAEGVRIDEHGQPGTGAWGPFAGVHYRYEQGRWLGFASLSGRVRTVNGFDYRYGSAALWSVHGQYVPTRRVVLDLGVDGRFAAADVSASEKVPNTGGTVLSLAPGVYVNAVGGAWLFVRGQIPVYEDLFGRQDVFPSVSAGVQLQTM
jgi:hypothetical protein